MNDAETMAKLVHAILATGNRLIREAGRLFKPHGISAVQFNVLWLLAAAEDGLRPSELTAALVVDASSTTYVVDRMEALGWLKRRDDSADRRAWRIVLTPAGRKTYARVAAVYAAALQDVRRSLRGENPATLAASLERMGEAAPAAADRGLQAGVGGPLKRRKTS
jgi:DNA-binding MarR family transcriptional regulator